MRLGKLLFILSVFVLPVSAQTVEADKVPAVSLDALKSADYWGGRKAFQGRCSACHTLAEDSLDIMGPNLWKMFDRKVGSKQGFNFSPAMQQADFQWSAEHLNQFLKNPKKYIPDNAMMIPQPVPARERLGMIAFMLIETGAVDWPRPERTALDPMDDKSLPSEQRFPSFWNHMMNNTVRYRMVSGEQQLVFHAYFHPGGKVTTDNKAEGFWYLTEKDFMCYAIHQLPITPSEFVECFPVGAMAIPRFAQELWESKPVDGVVMYGGMLPGRETVSD
ncbi:cytochrome c family protein [Oceanicoccus sp. KOV_DT_Chl]|uniref:c-type cytochrome n=1 Tax=Oceanicoccus sp. KOV_DT_Chl TaxID=1904639 RepID=UPI000C798D6B|nr:c-type cytochrome [Oceanicoccus sp. KOV_DT_Chl]